MTTCPRCGERFECGAAGDTPCWCAEIAVEQRTLADLRDRYDGCLCPACLAAVATGDVTRA